MEPRTDRGPRRGKLPSWVTPAVITLVVLSWVPLALIARARVTRSPQPRMQIIPDMDQQSKFKAQQGNPMFADTRAMRPFVSGTVARDEIVADEALTRGIVDGDWARTIPLEVTPEFMRRGRERYDIYCAPCHGLGGRGDGIVNARAERLQEGTWTPPTDLTSDVVVARPIGHIYNTISHGIRNMPAYGSQIPVPDRWAVAAYVRALQRSQRATIEDVPPEVRPTLR